VNGVISLKNYRTVKRIIDFIIALIGVILFSPVFAFLAVLIKLDSRGAVFFTQKRVGKNKTYFYIFKFRTMRTGTPRDMPTHMLQNPNTFITPVGRFLRKSSLDELPQIINILKGDMSIVGPRPALWNQDDLIAEREKYRANDIPPGLTGWAQINGRDELPIPVKAKLDGEYALRMSLWFDLLIFVKTILAVLKREGVKEGRNTDVNV